jgi:putative endonuclease
MERGGHVYILGSSTGTLYIGVTSGLYTRVIQHREGRLSGFAHKYACNRLLYAEPFASIDEAIAREKQLKGWRRQKKLDLIAKLNPEFKDMGKDWGWQLIHKDEPLRRPTPEPSS